MPTRDARAVHQLEHLRHALVELRLAADRPAEARARVAEVEDARRRRVDPHLVLDVREAHVVRAGRACRRGSVVMLRHDEERQPLRPGRRAVDAGEHEVHDVLGEVVIAGRDEDLRAADRVAAVGVARRRRLGAADVAAGLRLGQAHRARPLPVQHARVVELPSAPRVPNDSMTSAAPTESAGYIANAVFEPGDHLLDERPAASAARRPRPTRGRRAICFQPAS